MTRVYLGLGSNVGDRAGFLRAAIERLRAVGLRGFRVSPTYETAPVGYLDQGPFLNLVCEAQTDLSPDALLDCLQAIERGLGRVRSVRNGPRTIDIDLLLYGDERIATERVTVPHPRYRERRFVLQPLADLNGKLLDPETGESVAEMLGRVGDQEVRRFGGSG